MMAERKRDYYEVLELPRGASSEDIRRAYRNLAKKYHPDVNDDPNAEERFKEINEAYAVLSDEERKTAYDRYGHAGLKGMPMDFDFGINDIFEQFFGFGMGRRSRRQGPRRGADLRYELKVDFEEAVFGAAKEIEFNRLELCSVCDGSGAEPGTSPTACQHCNGTGEVRQVRQTFLGQMVNVNTCPHCGGKGEVIENPCRNCRGSGKVRNMVQKEVPIPAGVDSGTQIRIAGEGEPGANGGPPGDLYVAVSVRPHKYFQRKGDDIILDLGINVAQATLGSEITVPTVDGEESLTIPAGTQSGKVLRLPKKGVPHLRRDGRGDQLVVVSVEIPRQLDEEQRELFEQLAESMGTEINIQERGFLDRVKDLLGGLAD
ncbi:MAG: molecular chaperone DnaJ [Anaerolineales bacterium]